jgi:hypothetical protein
MVDLPSTSTTSLGSLEELAGIDFFATHATPKNRHTTMQREKPTESKVVHWLLGLIIRPSFPLDGSFSLMAGAAAFVVAGNSVCDRNGIPLIDVGCDS